MGLLDGYFSLSDKDNKAQNGTGILEQLPELSLSMKDDELISLSNKWLKRWADYEPEIKKKQEENENYWLGKHLDHGNDKPMVDNLIFEALETFLPMATKKNPEPFVRADESEEGQNLAKAVQGMLVYHADRLRLKLKLKRVTRFWALYLLGYVKHGWNEVENDIECIVRRPQNLILDPDAFIDDNMEYTGEYIGERMQETASKLIQRFPQSAEYITKKVNQQLGTKINYVEWWANNPAEYVFWTCDEKVLGKAKNPHWNYPLQKTETDEYGGESINQIEGNNHFNIPKSPFTFLSVFNLSKHPFDEASLIGQNISNQDLINKRNTQIDRNADSMNGGIVVSGERSGLTKEQASQATEAMRKGGAIWVPSGAANEAVYRDQAPALPGDVFRQMVDMREELRNIFGVRGSSPSGTINEQTATGKAIVRNQDSDRVGGGITEYLEQFADHIFNWWVQMFYVYYDEEHTASIVGVEKATEYHSLINTDFTNKLTVSVKEGSLIPDSDYEKAMQAQELLVSGNLDPITAFDRMGFANPRETAERVYMWKADPTFLFPELGQAIEQKQIQQTIDQANLQK